MIQIYYIDTSVLGGVFDEEFSSYSSMLIEEFILGNKIAAVSEVTLQELERAPKKVQNIYKEVSRKHIKIFRLDHASKTLANKYINEKAISPNFLLDAQHIAIATVNKVDVLVSWNFKHIVNLRRIKLYNSINLKNGYPLLEIRSPREVVENE